MSDHEPLTDEELGQLPDGIPITSFGRHLYRCRHYGWLIGTPSMRDQYDTCPPCDCGLAEATFRIGRLIDDLRASRAEVERLRFALGFYADRENWKAKRLDRSGPNEPNPGSESWESGPAFDCGERARFALVSWKADR